MVRPFAVTPFLPTARIHVPPTLPAALHSPSLIPDAHAISSNSSVGRLDASRRMHGFSYLLRHVGGSSPACPLRSVGSCRRDLKCIHSGTDRS